MFANFANELAASSADKLVEFPKSIITFVNDNISSVLIPNCPAASATADISVVLDGISFAISLMPCLSSSICASVPSTVFSTPAKASSKSIALLALATNAVPVATEKADIFLPAFSILFPTFSTFPPNSSSFLPVLCN